MLVNQLFWFVFVYTLYCEYFCFVLYLLCCVVSFFLGGTAVACWNNYNLINDQSLTCTLVMIIYLKLFSKCYNSKILY